MISEELTEIMQKRKGFGGWEGKIEKVDCYLNFNNFNYKITTMTKFLFTIIK